VKPIPSSLPSRSDHQGSGQRNDDAKHRGGGSDDLVLRRGAIGGYGMGCRCRIGQAMLALSGTGTPAVFVHRTTSTPPSQVS